MITDAALHRRAVDRYGSQLPTPYRLVSDLRCGYEQARRVLARMRADAVAKEESAE